MAKTNPTPSKKPARAKKTNVFDVSHPGQGNLAAGHTTRSIIGTSSVMPDPMVVANTKPADMPLAPTKKVVVQPLHSSTELLATETPEPSEAAAEPRVIVDDKPVSITPKTTVADVAPDIPEPVAIPAEHEEREADSEIARKRAERLQKMIDEEEYFLPIKTVEERRSRKVAIIGVVVILLLAAAWYNVALDAGLLPNTYDLPHTSFFTVK